MITQTPKRATVNDAGLPTGGSMGAGPLAEETLLFHAALENLAIRIDELEFLLLAVTEVRMNLGPKDRILGAVLQTAINEAGSINDEFERLLASVRQQSNGSGT